MLVLRRQHRIAAVREKTIPRLARRFAPKKLLSYKDLPGRGSTRHFLSAAELYTRHPQYSIGGTCPSFGMVGGFCRENTSGFPRAPGGTTVDFDLAFAFAFALDFVCRFRVSEATDGTVRARLRGGASTTDSSSSAASCAD